MLLIALKMAEFMAAVFAELAKAAVVTAVGKVSEKLNNEVLLISHFAKDIRQLQRRLITLQSYLNDADRALQTQQSDLVKQWIRDLWDSTMEAQDLVDICAAEGLITHASPSAGVKTAFRYVANLIPRRRMGLEIRNLDARLNEIEKRASLVCHMQQITASSSSSQSVCENPWRRSDVLHDEETSVDISPKMEEVICLVRQYRVVAVVGMGGSGKTRLLQHVYGSIKSNFEVSIWLSVSQSYTVQQLQFDVLSSIGQTPSREESQEMRERKVHDALVTKRNCLMVLDDVWELADNEKGSYLSVLEKLRRIGFPETPHCKILVSTRDRSVALQLQAQVHSMALLSYKKSQELFLKHVETPPQHFSEDASVVKILKRCGGLPLAIVAVAGILKHQDPGDWNHTLKQMETGIFHDPLSVVITALRLSYNALQPKAKSCFGFLGMFREDERIHSEKLIGMWRGEGLVQNHEDGFAVLQDLANRCLIELNIVVKLERVGFRLDYDYVESEVCYVKVHDMVHDVALSIFKCCGGITDEVPTSTSVSVSAEEKVTCPRILRMSLTNQGSHCGHSVRSLRVVGDDEEKVTSKFLESARALRALDLAHAQYMDLPPCVAKFKLLTFLDISHWFDSKGKLPECIRHLKQLEYLYAGGIRSVPTWIGDLKRLTHLSSRSTGYGYNWCSKVNKPMKNLRVLRGVVISIGDNSQDEDAASSSRSPTWTCTWNSLLSDFPQLQELHLEISRFQTGQTPPPCLHSLLLSSRGGRLTLPEEWLQCLERLQDLKLQRIELPGSIVLLGFQRLRRLVLNRIIDIAAEISKLPELMHLQLINLPEEVVVLPQEYGTAGAFPKLRSLRLDFCRHLRKLPSLEDGAMPCLRSLQVAYCTINEAPRWKEKVCSLHQFECNPSDGHALQEMIDAFKNRT